MNKIEEISKSVSFEIHPKSPVPIYYQLSKFLENLIQDEAFQPGDRFPTEEAIASYFQVSRPTANKAVQILINEGFLTRDKGLGTFVKEKPYVTLTFLGEGLSFADQFPPDVSIKSKIIWSKTIPATPSVAKALQLKDGEPTILIRRLRYAYNRPIMVCDSQLSKKKFPEIEKGDFIKDSLYNTLEIRYNCPVISSERYAYAVEINEPEVVKLLEMHPFSPILMIKGISFTKGNKPIDYMRTFLRQGIVLKNTVYRHTRNT
jgi:GntR family transcriptional regulator